MTALGPELVHALQAGTLAVRAGARPAVVAAALRHDIGRCATVAGELPAEPHERGRRLLLAARRPRRGVAGRRPY